MSNEKLFLRAICMRFGHIKASVLSGWDEIGGELLLVETQ